MNRFLHRLEDFVLISALVSMLAMALVQILLRNLFDAGFFWAESFLRILVLWVAMLGAMVATRENNHISIDVVSRFLPDLYVRLVGVAINLFSAAICATIAWYALEFVKFEYEDATIAFSNVPSWLCQSILPFGFLVMALRFFARAIELFREGE